MDIPHNLILLPLEDRLEAASAIQILFKSGLFESIVNELNQEVTQAAMTLAHSREYEHIERSAIRLATAIELFDGLKQAARSQQEN